MPPMEQQQHSSADDWEHRLRSYLLLLGSLAATVTYAAGLDPPGGSWVESDGEKMAVAGDSILRATHHRRYLAFYYSNATAFAASIVVILLLLVLADKKDRPLDTARFRFRFLWQQTTHLRVLRLVMVLDLLALMVAYTAGSCRDKVATIYTVALVAALSAYVGIHILNALHDKNKDKLNINRAPELEHVEQLGKDNVNVNGAPELKQVEQLRKVLMLLAIFAATITYNAGLKPPGGFWEHTNGLHRPGEVVLKHKHGSRFAVFFFCNTAAFIASLFTVVLLLDKKLMVSASATRRQQHLTLYGFVVATTLVTLVAAYAAGSCRKTASTIYTVALVAAVLVSIFLAAVAQYLFMKPRNGESGEQRNNGSGPLQQETRQQQQEMRQQQKKMSHVRLLATLAASITYQAGLNPPGGVWLQNQSGHNAGDPILLNTDPKRYNIFFYCNSTALVLSIVVILMVQIKALLKRRNTLHTAMILDLFGLMGAYIAGSSRTLRASVYVIALAAAFLVYVTGIYLHVKFNTTNNNNTNSEQLHQNPTPTTASTSTTTTTRTPNNSQTPDNESSLKKRLLLFAILMAAITYQAGLSPPGGFWRVDQGHSSAGSPILEVMYPRRYQAFFYCNAMSFMASIALIILLQDKNTYQPAGIRFYGLYACMLVGMLVLMGAYAAGTARRVKTSIYVFVLVGGVIGFIAVLLAWFLGRPRKDDNEVVAAPPPPLGAGAHQPSNANGSTSIAQNNNDDHPQRSPSTASSNANGGDTADNTQGDGDHTTKRKYVMLLAMLAASVTYQAGLDPPGGVWPEGYAAGSPVLHDSNLRRYHVFFYSNSSSFMASVVVIILLLQSEWLNMKKDKPQKMLLIATNIVVALDLVGLLVAYATGSCFT